MSDCIHLVKSGGTLVYSKFKSGKWQVYRTHPGGEKYDEYYIGEGKNMKAAYKNLLEQEKG